MEKKNLNGAAKKTNKVAPKKNVKKPAVPQTSIELQGVVKIVRYNANIKRHTALNILNAFVEDGFIDEAKGAFVSFEWDKYIVKSKGVAKEYQYDKTFVTALVKAHEDMSKDSSKAIKDYIKFANIQ